MIIDEFNKLEFEEKLYTVVDQGTFLDNYVTTEIRINLYSVDKFYVELVYNDEENKIVEIRSFKSGMQLDKYTGHIRLKIK